ncbi:MAG: hypothetical protein ABSE99_04935 [Terracidiphilus sp.]|jgi:hypothetical protein
MIIPRSWKDADGVAATRDFLSQRPPRRAAIRDLMAEVLSENAYARRCATDLARRVSAREPGILRQYADVLIDLIAELPLEQWQARGYVTLAAALNASTTTQRMRLAVPVRAMIEDERVALRAIALEAFALLAVAEPALRDEAMGYLEYARRDGTCALRSRAKRMLLAMLAAENRDRP